MAGSEQSVRDAFIYQVASSTVNPQRSARSTARLALSPADGVSVSGGKDSRAEAAVITTGNIIGEKEVESFFRRAATAIEEAAHNRGREANALKTVHEFLQLVVSSDVGDDVVLQLIDRTLNHLNKIKEWDKPQWFKSQPATLRDPAGRPVSEQQLIQIRNRIDDELMRQWDEWARQVGRPFSRGTGGARQQLFALDDYIVRRVALDSVKNWLRRRPAEQFINDMFAALALDKLYLDTPLMRLRCLQDETGAVRAVEMRDGLLFFEQSDELVPVKKDAKGCYVELPDDADMIVFEKRTLGGERRIVPVSQPNGRDPNIQWFNGAAVKRGWQKEQRFFSGPGSISIKELYGFFPDHFPMRLTNSQENRMPTKKVGGAIYGYAREHAGRQSRKLIAEFGEVMPGLKRNNSQLINDARQLFGLQRAGSISGAAL